ncbi:Hypothetical predicted protein [Octopus vulgaris]|uniref:Uncharacterized protein n=1 Tax=Octopus vulgaris TaxID=6645 RepID=A0AA36F0I3_OCTVU|nr:Hypothetical predicted protein [Octopus vulgaris]
MDKKITQRIMETIRLQRSHLFAKDCFLIQTLDMVAAGSTCATGAAADALAVVGNVDIVGEIRSVLFVGVV